MKAIINGKIVMPDCLIEGKALLFDKKIAGVCDVEAVINDATIEKIDAKGNYVAPGLVDMHIHGYLGEDASDGSADGIRKMGEGVVKNGVTSWLPTTMTVSYEELEKVFVMMRELRAESEQEDYKGAQILGINAEGPFINPSKKGAQAGEHIKPADAAFLKKYADVIRVFTIAPEMPGNLEVIEEIRRDTDLQISMGHTGATYEQAMEGIAKGVGHTTHLFNAMTPLAHRDPGVVAAALGSKNVSTELIADTFHVHPGLFQLVAEIKGNKLVLITDCTRAGGLPDGEYTLGGQPIFVKGIECRLADGTIAGSVLKLNNAVGNVLRNTTLPVWQVVRMASLNPAEAIGADKEKGSLCPGKDADVIIADADFNILATYIGGSCKYTA
ncbi:MAG: N-acetylglucosamine-6-phosphate deacetylase [Eubacteriales bacterium]|nr:N-acetylglucosamine-6-phosphate deacetylase [Eubacteriales bacterium]